MPGANESSDGNGHALNSVSGPHSGHPLLTAGAPALAAEAALILCHGRGATAQGVVNLFDPVYRHGVAVLAPQAERSRWYPKPASAPRADNEPWLTSSVECVAAALEAAREIDIPPERTVIGGFSQGACVAAEFVRRNPRRYGGLCCLSGVLPGAVDDDWTIGEGSGDDPLERTPVLFGYGEDDPHLDPERVARTVRTLENAGATVDERVYSDTGHEVTDDEFDAIAALLEGLLST
ncbi:alpha/beta hydrolase [Halopiger xanaduensis]|uniref:Phospholipase/Carboxylesterase n=1 Tax=Halopiger xanaduensis (strain DSM 18323 / JCM 14033 / SH-6) TaxID=797210 RepID=F8D567_HALXS|nr:phospholipase [Halopiger xanaduensis]AEH36419.1 phospholipase/Carboxylesterase [Halopiger xanaduensis SH-6]